ncbi:hypothetical protein [Tenacibaculum sp.]|uniref:hypothetical protein n=1 Tax=Tenacibaculum sp. TaxID=1906242 RepID=UPI003AA8AC7A
MWFFIILILAVIIFLFLKKDKERVDSNNYELVKNGLSRGLANLFNNYRLGQANDEDIKQFSYHFYKSSFALTKRPVFDLSSINETQLSDNNDLKDKVFYSGLYNAIYRSIRDMIYESNGKVNTLSYSEVNPLVDYLLKRNLDEIRQRNA